MKKIFTIAFLIAMVLLFGLPGRALAGENDTLVVYASGPALDQVINSDTISGGQAHSVYKLVSLDTTYFFLGQITPKSNITIVGILGSDGRPPCIQPGVLNDGSIPGVLFNITKKGAKAVFKNLYIEDLSTNGSSFHPARDILASADSVSIYVDNCVFEYNHGSIIGYTGNWCDFFITNSKFRNGTDPVTWTDALVVGPVWPATPAVDSIVIKYSTIFCINAYSIVAKPPARYVEFSHNSVVFSFLQPFWIFAANSAKINNNIFYSTFVGGETKAEYPWWDEAFSPEVPSIISFDTMDVNSDAVFDPGNVGDPNARMLAEAKRKIEVKNNVYFQPQAVKDMWTKWNNEHSGNDSLYTPPWMNNRTQNMFNDKNHWPGFVESGNIVGQDPGYGSSFANVLNGGGDYGVGLLEYFNLIRTGQSPTIAWGYHLPSISGDNWIPEWPLPETEDMKYSNTAFQTGATDGMPIGDPSWFGIVPPASQTTTVWEKSNAAGTLPAWFSTAYNTRNFAYNNVAGNNHLYVVNNVRTASIITLNAATGDSVGTLDTTGISGGTFLLDDIETSTDGVIFASNLTVNAKDKPFKIYKWTSENAKPTVVASFSDSTYRLGDHITVTGSAEDNTLAIWAAAAKGKAVLKFTTADHGESFAVDIIKLNDISMGVMPKVYPAGNNFFVASVASGVRFYDSGGALIGVLTAASPSGTAGVAYLRGKSPNREYVLVYDYLSKIVGIYDITDGLDKAFLLASTPTLGSAQDIQGTGDIALKTNEYGTLTIFVLGANNGLGAYSFNMNVVTSVNEDNSNSLPLSYSLYQNYPNPFNPTTNIKYTIPKGAYVKLVVYNILGKQIKTLVSTEQNAGTHIVQWNGTNDYGSKVASGIYFYRITAGDFVNVKKMILLK